MVAEERRRRRRGAFVAIISGRLVMAGGLLSMMRMSVYAYLYVCPLSAVCLQEHKGPSVCP